MSDFRNSLFCPFTLRLSQKLDLFFRIPMVYPIDFFHFSHNSTEKTPHQGIKKIDKNQKKLLNFYEKRG